MQDSVDRFLEALAAERGFSGNTIAAYRNDLTQFIAYVAAPAAEGGEVAIISWSDLSDAHLELYVLHMRSRDYASSTVARKTAAIKSFCHYLVEQGEMGSDPASRMTTPRVAKYTPRAITPDEVDRLLMEPLRDGSERRPEALRDHAMLETLYSTGMRVSELVALDVADVDLDLGSVRCMGKAGRERRVPLRDTAATALGRYLADARPMIVDADEAALFLNHRGNRLTRQGFWLILKVYAERADVGGITPHTLRHSFAAHALRHGAELRDVQQLLGHVSISTTQVYRRIVSEPEPVGAGIRSRTK